MKKIFGFIHHLLVPQEKNNYRARALHIDFLSIYLLAAIVLTFSFKTLNARIPLVLGFATDISTQKLYELTNTERQKNSLPPLAYNKQLSEAAQKKASDMFSKNYWSHFGPNGETPWQFILESGYRYEYAGENLAKNFLFSKGVIDAWMQSPTHRENMLKKDYTEVGYASVNGILNGEETTLVVQIFGKPQSKDVASQKETGFTPLAQNVQAADKAVDNGPLTKPVVNLRTTSLNIQVIVFSLLLLILGIDLYIAARNNVIRVTGKNLAHMIFIGFILLGIVILTRGKIV